MVAGVLDGGGLLLDLPSQLHRCPARQVHVQTQAGRVFTFQVRGERHGRVEERDTPCCGARGRGRGK
jgi:hypothetical protein